MNFCKRCNRRVEKLCLGFVLGKILSKNTHIHGKWDLNPATVKLPSGWKILLQIMEMSLRHWRKKKILKFMWYLSVYLDDVWENFESTKKKYKVVLDQTRLHVLMDFLVLAPPLFPLGTSTPNFTWLAFARFHLLF